MATSLDASVLRKGSDFLDEDSNMCDPCSFDGQSIPADRFCADCQEKYCTKCSKHHLSLGLTRKHTLLTLDVLNKTHRSVIKDKCSEKCTVHTDKTIKWYCGAHSSLGCSVCNGFDHKQCSNTIYIPTAATDIGNNVEFKQFDGNLRAIEKAFKVGIEDVENVLKLIAADDTELKNVFKALRKLLNEVVDQLEHDTLAQAMKIALEETKKLKALSKGLETSLDEIGGLVKNVDDLLKTGKNCDVFVTMKQNEAKLVRLNDELERTTTDKNFRRFEFRPCDEILKQASLGKLISQTANIDWRVSNVPALTPQQAEPAVQKTLTTESISSSDDTSDEIECVQAQCAVPWTVQTEDVSSRGRDQLPQQVDLAAMARRMRAGVRVRRGPHWRTGNEDGGGLGTVVGDAGWHVLGLPSWEVSWDCGTRGPYCMGGGVYQLEIE